MKKIAQLATQFDKKTGEIVKGVETGVQLFKDLIGGQISIKEIVNEFIDALQELPGKVSNVNELKNTIDHEFSQFKLLFYIIFTKKKNNLYINHL